MQQSGGNGGAASAEAQHKLAARLESVFSEAVYDHAALRDDVCHYVRELKQGGASAQGVIVAARNLIRETSARFRNSDRTETLLSQMLGWCLDEYYRESA